MNFSDTSKQYLSTLKARSDEAAAVAATMQPELVARTFFIGCY